MCCFVFFFCKVIFDLHLTFPVFLERAWLVGVNNDSFKKFQIAVKYRKACGMEPIRRCGNCLGGEGEKLKRCANCEEAYCSRECQVLSWELGHKNLCNKW